MHALLGLVILTGCSDRSCRLEDVLTERIGDADVEDCGDLPLGADDNAYEAAHDCVLAHADVEGEFVLRWALQGIDSRVTYACAGLTEPTGYQRYFLRYDGDPGGGGGDGSPLTVTSTCTAIADLGDCLDEQHVSLCLACEGAAEVDRCDAD